MLSWINLIGKKIDCVRGEVFDRRQKRGIEPRYILFTDKKTMMRLESQDYHSYHDCSGSAREIEIFEDKNLWKTIKGDIKRYPNVREDR